MRILNLSTYTWQNGGPTQVIYETTRVQLKMGHEVDILSPYNDGDTAYPLPKGARLFAYKKSIFSKLYPDYSPEIYYFLKNNLHKYDVVHVHALWNFPGMIALLSKHPKLVKFVTIHGSLAEGAFAKGKWKKQLFGWLIQKRALRKADAIQVYHEQERQEVQRFMVNEKLPITLIPNGIRVSEYETSENVTNYREKLGIRKDEIVITFMARLSSLKGVGILLPAFKRIMERANVRLILAGPDYGMKAFIQEFIESNQLQEKIIPVGLVKGMDKVALLRSSDIFILPSFSEGFSMATLEAAASGLPLLVTDIVGFAEDIVATNSGKIIEPTEESTANGLKEMLKLDKTQLRAMGERAQALVREKYDIEVVVRAITDAMQNALNAKLKK